MSAITRDRLKQIFDSGEIDPVTRTNRLKEQDAKLKAQEARIKELEELSSQQDIKKEKPTKPSKQKKVLSDDEKQVLKERLALGRKKKALEKQEVPAEPDLEVVKPSVKAKSKMTSEDIDIDDLLDKMNQRLKQKALEKQSQLKAETAKTDKSLTPVTAESRPESRPESVLTSKYNKFLRNVSKPKYY
jgi:hypothetical protein